MRMKRGIILGVFFISAALLSSCGGGGGGGSSCASNEDCSDTQFCRFDEGACGSAGGSCSDVPAICTNDMAPVCSCEKLTFFNDCWAEAAGQSIQANGECP